VRAAITAAAVIYVGSGSVYRYYPFSALFLSSDSADAALSRWNAAAVNGCQPVGDMSSPNARISAYLRCPFLGDAVTTAETITGRIDAKNERGIRVGGERRNVSKFKPLELPPVDATISLGLDPKGFINTLEVLDGDADAPTSTSARDSQIARLTVLKAAPRRSGAPRPQVWRRTAHRGQVISLVGMGCPTMR
jgi:hypothetical protein